MKTLALAKKFDNFASGADETRRFIGHKVVATDCIIRRTDGLANPGCRFSQSIVFVKAEKQSDGEAHRRLDLEEPSFFQCY